MRSGSWVVVVIMLMCSICASAASPIDVHSLDDPVVEARYKALLEEFRCPKCLNTNLSGSDAPIAADLRATVYRLITAQEMSDDEIRSFLHTRYGDFVLYDPPFKPQTWLLWLGPLVMLMLGGLTVMATVAKRRGQRDTALTAAERQRLDELLKDR